MKNFLILSLLLIAIGSLNAQNLIVNGDFEAWTGNVPDSWTTIDAGIHLSPETTTIHGGTNAMNVWVTTATQSNTDFRQTVSVTNGNIYDISLWVYQLDNGSRVTLFIDGTWTNVYSDTNIVNSWQEITYQYTATADAVVPVGLRFYDTPPAFADSSNMIVDDFTMFDVTGTGSNPYVTNVVISPTVPTSSDPVDVYADITDDGTIVSAYTYWSTDGITFNDSISMSVFSGDTYMTDTPIPAQTNGTIVYYYVKAIDNNAEEGSSPTYTFVIPYGVPFGDCQNLFFSEYIEGSSYNKVLEIYNPTPSDVDLSNYSIQKFNNGSTTVSGTLDLVGIIPSGGTYVLANSNADSVNVLPLADLITGFVGHNGNDAYVLFNYVDTIDVFGEIGSSSNFDIDTVSGGAADHTLIRKPDVLKGQLDWTIGNTEWLVLGVDDFSDLGQHTINGCVVNVQSLPETEQIGVYPNPANNRISFDNLDKINTITVVDITGAVKEKIDVKTNQVILNTENYSSGMYFALFIGHDQNMTKQKIVIQH